MTDEVVGQNHEELINQLITLCESSQFDQIESAALLATSANILMHRYIDAEPHVKYSLASKVSEIVVDGFESEGQKPTSGSVRLAIY